MAKIKLEEMVTPDHYHYIINACIGIKYFPQALVCYIYSFSNTLYIADICIGGRGTKRYINKGYGSLLMQKLIDYAKNNGYSAIEGSLANQDIDHRDRQMHFYEKFGFEISEPDHNNECKITLTL